MRHSSCLPPHGMIGPCPGKGLDPRSRLVGALTLSSSCPTRWTVLRHLTGSPPNPEETTASHPYPKGEVEVYSAPREPSQKEGGAQPMSVNCAPLLSGAGVEGTIATLLATIDEAAGRAATPAPKFLPSRPVQPGQVTPAVGNRNRRLTLQWINHTIDNDPPTRERSRHDGRRGPQGRVAALDAPTGPAFDRLDELHGQLLFK